MIQRLCFCGHTHESGVFTQDMKFYPPRAFAHKVKVSDGRKYYINIGSVGQPRDRDTRSCYVLWDPENELIEWRRVNTTTRRRYSGSSRRTRSQAFGRLKSAAEE